MNVVPLRPSEPAGTILCVIQLWRRPDGSIQSVLSSMDGALIETTGDDVPSRVAIVADWIRQGADDMDAQSREWLQALQEPRP